MPIYIDRYANFRVNGTMKIIPNIKIDELPSDKKIVYKVGETRLDKISDDYYNTPYYSWLIMLANGQYGGLEFTIPDLSIIRIPYPFESAISRYLKAVENYNILYGEQ